MVWNVGARREVRRRAVEHGCGDLGERRVHGQVEEEPHPAGGRLQRVHLLPRGQHRPQGLRDEGLSDMNFLLPVLFSSIYQG